MIGIFCHHMHHVFAHPDHHRLPKHETSWGWHWDGAYLVLYHIQQHNISQHHHQLHLPPVSINPQYPSSIQPSFILHQSPINPPPIHPYYIHQLSVLLLPIRMQYVTGWAYPGFGWLQRKDWKVKAKGWNQKGVFQKSVSCNESWSGILN